MLRFSPRSRIIIKSNNNNNNKISSSSIHPPKIFSFSGSGWMMIFHLGAVRALQERPELLQHSIFCGASGGALAAAVAALNVNTEILKDHIIKKSEAARRNKIDHFRLRPLVTEGVDLVLKEVGFLDDTNSNNSNDKQQQQQEAWKRLIQPQLQIRCQVFILGLPEFSTIVEDKFETKRTFVEALVASCCIPPFAGMPFYNEKGKLVVDGGLLKMVPRAEEKGVISVSFTNLIPQRVTISPASARGVAGKQAIPYRWALFPPNAKKMEGVYWAGYREMKGYLETDPDISARFPVQQQQQQEKDQELDKIVEEMVPRLPQYERYLMKLILLNVMIGIGSMWNYIPWEMF